MFDVGWSQQVGDERLAEKTPITLMMRECHFVNDEPHLNNDQ